MYLAKLVLDPSSKQARNDLSSPYQLHATLCRALATSDQTPPRFLWRLEQDKAPQILLQSKEQPNWGALVEKFPQYFADPPQTKVLHLDQLENGQRLRFRLLANPTVTKKHPTDPDSKKRFRHGLKDIEEQLEWLNRQGAKGGFSVVGAVVAKSERVKMFKHDRTTPSIVVQSALFEGHLKVSDLEMFRNTLQTGIGHAKALGFGLLSISKG